ncbi:MAG: MFS transporter [Actinobacteria bacterium]|nr:MFS transporter [Actinomycetota bacterium]
MAVLRGPAPLLGQARGDGALRRLGPLAERDFRLLFLGRLVSLLGSAVAPIALSFAVLDDLDGSASDLGLVLAAGTIPTIVFLLAGGVFADRLPRHHVMVGSDLLEFAAQAGTAALVLTGTAELWHLMALAAVRGTGAAFFFPAVAGLVPQVVTSGRLQEANAVLRLSLSSSFIVGAAVGGILVGIVGSGWALAFDALTFLASAALLSQLRLSRAETLPPSTMLADLRDGWREFASRTWLWAIVIEFAFVNAFASGVFQVLGPVVAQRSLGGAAAWGLILTGSAVGLVLGGLVTLRWKPERPLLVASLAILLGVPQFLLLAEAAPLAAIVLAGVVTGIGHELFGVFWDTTLQQHVPREKLSRVSSYDWLGSIAIMPLGLAVAGPIAGWIGVRETLWAAGALLVVATALIMLVSDVRGLRRIEAAPAG